jgi:hypothetical protein
MPNRRSPARCVAVAIRTPAGPGRCAHDQSGDQLAGLRILILMSDMCPSSQARAGLLRTAAAVMSGLNDAGMQTGRQAGRHLLRLYSCTTVPYCSVNISPIDISRRGLQSIEIQQVTEIYCFLPTGPEVRADPAELLSQYNIHFWQAAEGSGSSS